MSLRVRQVYPRVRRRGCAAELAERPSVQAHRSDAIEQKVVVTELLKREREELTGEVDVIKSRRERDGMR